MVLCRLHLTSASILALVLPFAACSGPLKPPPPQLSGLYLPTSAGNVRGIAFGPDGYVAYWAPGPNCPQGDACTELGIYAFNADQTALLLTNSAGGQQTALAFDAATAVAVSELADEERQVGGLGLEDTAASLVGLPLGRCRRNSAQVVASATLAGQGVKLVDAPAEVSPKVSHCFQHDWTTFPMQSGTDPRYQFAGTLRWITTLSLQGSFEAIGYVFLHGSSADEILTELETQLAQTVASQHLADYQRAALVTCVSSNLFTYGATLLSIVEGSRRSVADGEGMCFAFATVAARLFKSVGVQGGLQVGYLTTDDGSSGEGHAFNWVTLPSAGGATYWMEPQFDPTVDPDPLFFNRQDPPTACQSTGNSFCAATADACGMALGSIPSNDSCAGSSQGSQCCSVQIGPPTL